MRFRQRRNVVLPHPDGPINAVISFFEDRQVDVADRAEVAVEHGEVGRGEHDLSGGLLGLGHARRFHHDVAGHLR